MATEARGPWRFGILLAALVFFTLLMPFVAEADIAGRTFVRVGLSVVLLTAIYAVSDKRWVFIVALVLALPTLTVQWATHFIHTPAGSIARLCLSASFFWFTAAVVLAGVLRQREVSADTILGGISVYLLMVLAFTLLHLLVATLQPGAYQVVSAGYSRFGVEDFALALYFSFVTLTTLGYGDITPLSRFAQMLTGVEAMTGQLFVAILIARLVGMHVGQRPRDEG